MKLLRARKKFGRCNCKGHGNRCEVSREIQSIPISRATEKAEARKEIVVEVGNG